MKLFGFLFRIDFFDGAFDGLCGNILLEISWAWAALGMEETGVVGRGGGDLCLKLHLIRRAIYYSHPI